MPNSLTRDELMRNYWRYYFVLESKFLHILDYVELDESNYNTYSHEFAMLQQSIGAELDDFFKVYCGFETSNNKNISDYANYILSEYPEIVNQKISLMGYDTFITPYAGWNVDEPSKSLFWWKAFTQVKHDRSLKYKEANLKNVLYILGALYILELRYLSKVADNEPDVPDKESSIFEAMNWNYRYIPLGKNFAIINGAVHFVIEEG